MARRGALAGTCGPRPGPAGSDPASPKLRAPWAALGPPLGRARTHPHPAVRVGGASRGRAPPSPRWRRCPGRPRPPARWPCGPRPAPAATRAARPRRSPPSSHAAAPVHPQAAPWGRRRRRVAAAGRPRGAGAAAGRQGRLRGALEPRARPPGWPRRARRHAHRVCPCTSVPGAGEGRVFISCGVFSRFFRPARPCYHRVRPHTPLHGVFSTTRQLSASSAASRRGGVTSTPREHDKGAVSRQR